MENAKPISPKLQVRILSLLLMISILAFCGCNQPPSNKPESAPTTIRVFTASWCAACKADEPRLERLRKQGVVIEKIDVDADPELAGKFGVRAVPAYFRKTQLGWERISIR